MVRDRGLRAEGPAARSARARRRNKGRARRTKGAAGCSRSVGFEVELEVGDGAVPDAGLVAAAAEGAAKDVGVVAGHAGEAEPEAAAAERAMEESRAAEAAPA